MAAWEPPINPFTGSPETPDARLPPSLRPRMGKGRAYVLLAVDAHGEWRGTGAACDTPAAAERAWLAQRGRGCALLRLGASGWEVLRGFTVSAPTLLRSARCLARERAACVSTCSKYQNMRTARPAC